MLKNDARHVASARSCLFCFRSWNYTILAHELRDLLGQHQEPCCAENENIDFSNDLITFAGSLFFPPREVTVVRHFITSYIKECRIPTNLTPSDVIFVLLRFKLRSFGIPKFLNRSIHWSSTPLLEEISRDVKVLCHYNGRIQHVTNKAFCCNTSITDLSKCYPFLLSFLAKYLFGRKF